MVSRASREVAEGIRNHEGESSTRTLLSATGTTLEPEGEQPERRQQPRAIAPLPGSGGTAAGRPPFLPRAESIQAIWNQNRQIKSVK